MKTMLTSFAGQLLSKEQMRTVKGGTYQQYTCKCSGSSGGYMVAAESAMDAGYYAQTYCGNNNVSCSTHQQ
jgi:natural product precursor